VALYGNLRQFGPRQPRRTLRMLRRVARLLNLD
jgi:hypothetical protein